MILLDIPHISAATHTAGMFSQTHTFLPIHGFAQVLAHINIDPNPREPKANSIVTEILNALERTPSLYSTLTKGCVIVCESLALANRSISLSFETFDATTPCGILDGGHNCYALCKFLLNKSGFCTKKAKTWSALKSLFNANVDAILEFLEISADEFPICVPVTFLYCNNRRSEGFNPTLWKSQYLEISKARNTSASVNDAAIAYNRGILDCLEDALPSAFRNKVEWRTNDGGTIEARDVATLALIPLKLLDPSLNLSQIYSSKATAFSTFTQMVEAQGQRDANGDFEITNECVVSAFDMVFSLIEIFEFVQDNFQRFYNAIEGSRYGGLGFHKTSKKALTKFNQTSISAFTPDGIVYPLVCAVHKLMLIENDRIVWRMATNPTAWIEAHARDIFTQMQELMKAHANDPQKMGKAATAYQMMELKIETLAR